MKNIQSTLLSAFESSGLTYDDLAKRTNLPKSALYRYLNGDTEKIPIDRFQAVCHELNVDAATLLGWSEKPPDVQPKNDNVRLLINGINRMSPEDIEQLTNMMRVMFDKKYPDLLEKGTEDNANT